MDDKIREIVILNNYLTLCKLNDSTSKKSEIYRQYLNLKIRKALESRTKKHKSTSILDYIFSIFF